MANDHLTPREDAIQPGEPAPDFTLPDQDRQEWTLSEHLERGDVVLCFFPFAFTGVCGTEMECLTREMDKYAEKGVTAVGVSCDSFAALKAWSEREGLKHTMLSDLHRNVCRAYGIFWPEMNVAGRGTVVISGSSDGTGVVKWTQVRPIGEAMDFEQVMASLA
jgi:peroxiredoxin